MKAKDRNGEPIQPMRYRPTLVFEGGSLAIERSGYAHNGDGILSFNDDDLEYEHHMDYESAYRYIRLPKSELVAIRDFLIRELPLVQADCDCGAPTDGKWADKHSPHCSSVEEDQKTD